MTGIVWFGVLLAASLAVFILRSEYEKKHFLIEEYQMEPQENGKDHCFVFLSDLHNNQFGENNSQLIAAIHRIHPEGVLVGGDMMVSKGLNSMEPAITLLKELAVHYKVYHGYGNHESRMYREWEIYGNQHEEYRNELEACGVVFLKNSSIQLGEDLVLSGLELDEEYYKKFKPAEMTAAYIEGKIGKAKNDKLQILLSHSPLYMEAYRTWGANLVLAGHFHGGTIRLPQLGGVMTPQYQFFLPWCAGDFQKGNCRMMVSRGLGTHSINIRINNKPQLIVISIKSKPVQNGESLQTRNNQ